MTTYNKNAVVALDISVCIKRIKTFRLHTTVTNCMLDLAFLDIKFLFKKFKILPKYGLFYALNYINFFKIRSQFND